MKKGATHRAGRRTGKALLAVPALVAACASPGAPPARTPVATPEVFELANMRPSNVVPKSSPKALVSAFQKYCLNGPHDPARVAASLRAADFVAVPNASSNGVSAFVVDDSRPMVMISQNGRTCAVAAAARTGQTARIRSMIAGQFPQARPVDPATVSPNTELAVNAPGTGVIFVQRLASEISNSRLILGVLRDN
jgi:hypothetical protein